MGPERPDLKMQQQSIDRGRTYTRSFSSSLYANRSWLAGCSVSDEFFCFPCLLFQSPGTETIWTATGIRDLKHFNDICKKHESCRSHLTNSLKLSLFGRLSIAEQLDEGEPNWHSKTCSIIQCFWIYSALNLLYNPVFLNLFYSKLLVSFSLSHSILL